MRTLHAGVEEQFRLLVDCTPDYAIFLVDTGGLIETWNHGAERVFGYVADEVLGRHFALLFTPEDRELGVPEQELATAAAVGRANDDRWQLKRSGERFWASGETVALRDEGGALKGYGKVARDLTGPRRLEQQLRQAQKMEAVGRLAAGVVHDFNNLLTIVLGFGELATAELPPGSRARDLVGQMTKAGERASGLTRQLLAFSRQQPMQPEVLDLNAVVADIEKMLRRAVGEDVTLATVLQPGLGRVKADRGQVEQVLLNLAVNARDAMPAGGRLTVETHDVGLDAAYVQGHAEAHAGPHVLLAVSDDGCGMDAATKSHLFEPFFTTKPAGQGTGLGLATVYGIVKQSKGHVEVYSEVGVGTTVKVYLPRAGEAAREPAPHFVPAPAAGTETVLLAEDEEAVRELARLALHRAGYAVLTAGSGEEALRVAAAHGGPVHLLATDVVMPGGMGGRELARRLLEAHPGLHVLYLSGYTSEAVIRHGVLEADVHYLQKPFTASALAAKVRAVLDGSPAGPATQGNN
jgi:PAS domain S-box-containing protein